MNSLNLDFRDGCLRILVIRDSSVKYSEIIEDFPSADNRYSQEKLTSAIAQAGGKKGDINLILPGDIFKFKFFQTPAMDIEDAGKIIKREISKELNGQKFVFSLRRVIKDGTGRQEIFAEYALASDIIVYIDLLKACGLRPDMIITGFEGNLHLFNRLRPKTDGNEVVIDIGLNFIEIAYFNDNRLVEYEKIPVALSDDRSSAQNIPDDQKDKMKSYKIIDLLYNSLMSSGRRSPEDKPSAIWLCGLNSTIEGISDSISNGVGLECKILNPLDASVNNGSAFTALSGISMAVKTEIFNNMIPAYIIEERTRLLKTSLLAVSLCFYIILIVGGSIILSRIENDLKLLLTERERSVQMLRSAENMETDIYSPGKETLSRIASESPMLYSVLRDIANLTPSGITLSSLEVSRAQDITTLTLDASIEYRDESFKNAVMSKFLASLESSPRLKRVSEPLISTPKMTGTQNTVIIKASYEVVR